MTLTQALPGRIRRLWGRLGWTRWVLALLVGAAVLVLIFHGKGGTPYVPGIPGAPSAGSPTDTDQSWQGGVSAPAPVTWDDVQGSAVPNGGQAYGPVHNDDALNLHTGYAHTPRGAVIALEDISTRSTVGDWSATANAQLTGPGKQAWLLLRGGPNAGTPNPCQYAGFRMVHYQPTSAVVDVAVQCPDRTLQAVVETVTWDGGDWQLVVPVKADAPRVLTDLLTFTSFFPGQDSLNATAG